uniref:GRAM domain-containing protein n=1 Tax=Sinocyclocheilus grahami TaxID=75366 RepID=A0A672RS54_SINGR
MCCSWEHAPFIVSISQNHKQYLTILFIYLLNCCDLTSQGLEVSGQCIAAPQSPEALLYTIYKQRSDEFRKLFKEVSESEKLIADYTCALQKDILLQGRIYLTENCLCFYSHVFRGTKDIISILREKTAKWIPNAIQINTNSEKLFFSSFSAREKSFLGMFRYVIGTGLPEAEHLFSRTLPLSVLQC